MDSQSVDTTSGGEQRGRDNAKNVDGRKRHIVVDSMGLLLAVLVTAADVDDAKAAAELFARLEGQPMSQVGRMFADSKYHNYRPLRVGGGQCGVGAGDRAAPEGCRGWVKLPIRWTVERTFAWLGKCRRLSKDRERSVLSSEAFVKLAMIHLMLNRLEPKDTGCRVPLSPGCINPLMGQSLTLQADPILRDLIDLHVAAFMQFGQARFFVTVHRAGSNAGQVWPAR